MNHRGRWRIGALASAIALLGSLASLEVHALSLGRITVQSALGEPLRGEIDITDINPAEASSLKIGLASAETFMAAGMDYPSSAAGLEIKLQRRADGRPYLRLNSRRAITEPFMDLIVEANWESGRITRDYTMLFDPPRAVASSAPPIVPIAPMLPRPSVAAAAIPPAVPMADMSAPVTSGTPGMTPSIPKTPAQPASRPAPLADRTKPSADRPAPLADIAKPPEPATAAAARPSWRDRVTPGSNNRPIAGSNNQPIADSNDQPITENNNRVVVKRGDTATKIALNNKPADVSLDQMLVAILVENPDAFIGKNVNTIKSGAVLNMPTSETASALSATEARQIVIAQSRDFNAYRRKLSESVSSTPVTSPTRQDDGKVEAKVADNAQTTPSPDKLTLSNGTVKGAPASKSADNIIKEKQVEDTASRVAELNKNISDLNKLGVSPAIAASASKPAAVPAITVATPPSLSDPAQAALPAASAATDAGTATDADTATASATPASAASAAEASAASAPVAVKKPAVKTLPPPPEPEPELMDQLMENAVPLLGGVGILALLGGLVFMRNKKKKKSKTAPVDSSFLESRLQPDSFFGASGGSRVNTNNEHSLPGSSMAYTPSQMDASGDVDPVAEADVYLAYGRDEQAEDILKEALHTHPGRPAIHAKLLEIYAKRGDKDAFESLAGEAFKLTQGQGPEWTYIVELGNELDPGNALYQAGEAAPDEFVQNDIPAPTPASAAASAPSAEMDMDMDMDLDLDMDFSLDAEAAHASVEPVTVAPLIAPLAPVIPDPEPIPPAPVMSSAPSATPPSSSLDDLDLGLDFDMTPTAPKPPAAAPAAAQAPMPEIDLLSNGLDFTPMPVVAPKPAPAPAAAAPADNGMMEFDLDAFSLDLAPVPAIAAEHAQTETQEEDPLEIKFMLAEEFRSLGDTDGARSLADEVLAKAKGPLKTKVQSFLNELA